MPVVVCLASAQSSFVYGADIAVDGGLDLDGMDEFMADRSGS